MKQANVIPCAWTIPLHSNPKLCQLKLPTNRVLLMTAIPMTYIIMTAQPFRYTSYHCREPVQNLNLLNTLALSRYFTDIQRNKQLMNIISPKRGLDVIQSYLLCRTRFGQYQAFQLCLRWELHDILFPFFTIHQHIWLTHVHVLYQTAVAAPKRLGARLIRANQGNAGQARQTMCAIPWVQNSGAAQS